MFPNLKTIVSKLSVLLFAAAFLCGANLSAQTKKPAASKQTVKKPDKTIKKEDAKKQTASAKDKTSAKEKQSKTDTSKDKTAANSKIKQAESQRKQAEKLAEQRRAEEARRQAEAARQQVLAEQRRRREQAIREAQARRAAFERGLRTETLDNIRNDSTDGEDLEVRRAAVNSLGNRAGMVVVMEAQTGKILTIVNQDWAVRQSYRPCSTIKLVTGVAGLNEHVINEQTGSVGNFRMNLDDALAFSNNAYFQKVGGNLGNSKFVEYERALGLGEPTGINLPGEANGKLAYGNNSRLIYSHGDDTEMSPLQLAVLVSAISNGGKLVVPQVPRSRTEQVNYHGFLRRTINLPLDKLTGVIPGMIGSAEYGTAHRGVDASMGVAGKTGSCIGKGSWLGLFASVAPIENPKYAVVVITRGEAERGKYAAAVAGRVYEALRPRLLANAGRSVALTAYNQAKPHSQVSGKTADKLAVEDEDEGAIENEDGTLTADRNAAPKKATAPLTPQKSAGKKGEDWSAPVVIKVKNSGGEFTRPRIVNNR